MLPLPSRRAILAGLAASLLPLRARAATETLTYVTPYGFDITFYEALVARSAGLFAAEGLDVVIEPGQNAVQGIQQVLAGGADLTRTVGINMMRAAADQGAPLMAIATLVPGPFFNFYAHADRPLTDPGQLAGRTVGIVAHRGATDVALDLMLIEAGVDPASVTREIAPDNGATFALVEAGRIDGWIGGPSTLHRLQAAGLPVAAARIDNGIPSQVLVATPDAIDRQGPALVAYLRAIRAAVALVDSLPPAEALALLAQYDVPALADPAIALADLALATSFLSDGGRNRFVNPPDLWAGAVERLVAAGLMSPFDPTRLYTNALIDLA